MKIKVKSISVVKNTSIGLSLCNENVFRVNYMKLNTDSKTLKNSRENSDILKCLKYCVKENENTIDYNEISELVDTSNIIGNNFWSVEEFENVCRFEFRNYFDFSECEFIYL